MRKTIFSKLFAAAIFFTLTLAACEGPEGPRGPRGEDGLDGQDGNANVKSEIFTINQEHWVESDDFGVWYHVRETNLMTQDIVDYGAVLFYMKDANGINSWLSLPVTNVFEDTLTGTYSTNLEPWHELGAYYIQWRDSHPEFPLPPDWDITIKAVAIEGAPANMRKLEAIDPSKYEEVRRAFKLAD